MVVFIYCFVLLALGYALRRSARNAAGFFLAGRGLRAHEVGLSLAATAFGGSAILIASMLVYRRGLGALWFSGSVAVGFGVLGLLFARRIRAGRAHSLADWIGRHYGHAARWVFSVLIVVVEVAFFGLTIKSFVVLTGTLAGDEMLWGMSPATLQALVCAVFVVYTLMGGHKAVAATDLIQLGIVAVVLLGVLLVPALAHTDWSALPPGYLRFPFSTGAGPAFAVNYVVLMGLSGIVGGDVFSKILSARDERAARTGALIAAAVMGALAVGVALLAVCARARGLGTEQPELSIILLARDLLPVAMFQIVLLALLSILLSTADSVLITGATVLTLDVLGRSERSSIRVTRLATLCLALAGLALAWWFEELLEIMRFGYTLLVAPVVAPVLFTLAARPAHQPSGNFFFAAVTAGAIGAIAANYSPNLFGPFAPATIGVAASGGVMLVGWMTRLRG